MAQSRKHPDLSDEAAKIRQAAEHDAWFRAKVQKSLDKIANGTAKFISHEEHRKRWQKKRAELLARIEQHPHNPNFV